VQRSTAETALQSEAVAQFHKCVLHALCRCSRRCCACENLCARVCLNLRASERLEVSRDGGAARMPVRSTAKYRAVDYRALGDAFMCVLMRHDGDGVMH
jgi:hypothetical protein